ncbi:hypothetical protein WR164_00140 [Philodulcilactobacillus myokoensis]|uniref:NAD(P)-binding domain-containing protein n=1 Tax=Philodulcilactobacillus myokoensis TaxID=2929573 RepID=A0A9W6AZV2_9LACO|nr:NAD(P)-binding oxidoreductase [Philodulcilactobacillus myokoensis]GLB46035.1 hypothetical protein WR164_00140 [Philodulcilactobacillus myokoensis]
MEKVLILGDGKLAEQLTHQFDSSDQLNVQRLAKVDFTKKESYQKALNQVNVIVSLLGPLDVDLDFEALFDAIREVQPPVKQFVMLSTAGIDHEVNGQLTYPNVSNVKEYLNQQRYAAKVLDESEISYTILRPTQIVKQTSGYLKIIPEGAPVSVGKVSIDSIISIINQIVLQKKFIGESLGMIDQ